MGQPIIFANVSQLCKLESF